ncbi:MAG TPA: DEAD/DEAH box helicase [Polyangiaceae bacterium]
MTNDRSPSSAMHPASSTSPTGTDPPPPPPPPTFDILPLSRETLEALATMGYTHPTPVQRAVFEPASRGLDLVVQARTGTGKTAAFGLPVVETIVRRNLAAVQVVVLCPTRELALQVTAELERLGRLRQVRAVPIYGGAPMNRQIEQLSTGAQVVVGTPGRVLDHLRRGTLDASQVRMLVLDEADEMLSMGFERELSAILERLPKGRQTLLFSATIPPDIERIAKERLREPEFITLSGDHVGALEVAHLVYLVREDKLGALLRILEVENPEGAIIFCNTKAETERVAEALERQGFPAAWLNGDLPQSEREEVMRRTRQGKLRFLVATDVAARGIDISHLTHVINFDFPESAERYVHRTGRTGRAGRTGTAIALVAPQDIGHLYLLRLTYKIRPIEKQLPTAGERKTREETDLVQMLAEAFRSVPTHPDDSALARRLLSHDDAERIVAALIRYHLGERPEAIEQAAAARRSRAIATPEPPRAPARSSEARPEPKPRAESPRVESRPLPRAESRPEVRAASPRAESRPDVPRVESRPDAPRPEAPRADAPHAAVPRAEPSRPGAESPRIKPPRSARANPSERHSLGVRWSEEPHQPASDASFAEIFVNLGRRDGVNASDFQRVLADLAGIAEADVGSIRVRDRSSFVSVKRETLEKALAAIHGKSFAGKVAQAEVARARSSGTSSTNDN